MADSMSKESRLGGRLIPVHPAGEFEGKTPGERRAARQEALDMAEPLEGILRQEMVRGGVEVSDGTNLSLRFIEEFQQKVREAQDLRKVIKAVERDEDKVRAMGLYSLKREQINQYLDYGVSFEAAYREYLRARNEFINFETDRKELVGLENLLTSPVFASIGDEKQLDQRARARLEALTRSIREEDVEEKADSRLMLEALSTIYPKGSDNYEEFAKKLESPSAEGIKMRTKGDIKEEIARLREKINQDWESPMVRWFWQKKELVKLSRDFARGEDVLETQNVIAKLNTLAEWEKEHQRTTIGGVLVGPPGVGKTTLIRHYLELTGRRSVYIDLSEDVTRYMLYGSKSIEFKNPSELHRDFLREVEDMDEDKFKSFVKENAVNLEETFGISGDEATVLLIENVLEGLEENVEEGLSAEKVKELKSKVQGFAQRSYFRELGSEFNHLVKRNGWRDGVIIAALRRGESVILDEFNKNKNWSLIFGLMTAKPGENWYFADNDEWIKIPNNWRMYFTANIGRKHGGFEVPEALASRAGGKVLEVDYPTFDEEMRVALVALSDTEGNFLRSREDLVKLFVTVHELFPKIRKYIEDKRQTIPISYRTIRDLGEKMVMTRDRKTGQAVFAATNKSFDEALYEVLVATYGVYEDKTLPFEIVNLATSMGLLMDDSVGREVKGFIGDGEFEKRKQTAEENKEDFAQIANKIRGVADLTTQVMPLPAIRKV